MGVVAADAGDADEEEVKSVEELLALGGRFYILNGAIWCDTTLDSWKFVPGKGFVRQQDETS